MVDVPSSVVVVVPARNEEKRLGACLGALGAATHRLRSVNDRLPVRIVLVLDRCTDRTAVVAARWPIVDVVVTDHGRVGAARAAGIAHAVDAAERDVDAMWIANTDADSRVPVDWLQTHLKHARMGADLLLGMVKPNPAEVDRYSLLAWHDRHDFNDGHGHVHGANMGVRGGTYTAAGGFPDVAVDEDVALAGTIRGLGGRVISTPDSPVITSSRLSGRTPGGMAAYLRGLARSASRDPFDPAAEVVA